MEGNYRQLHVLMNGAGGQEKKDGRAYNEYKEAIAPCNPQQLLIVNMYRLRYKIIMILKNVRKTIENAD